MCVDSFIHLCQCYSDSYYQHNDSIHVLGFHAQRNLLKNLSEKF